MITTLDIKIREQFLETGDSLDRELTKALLAEVLLSLNAIDDGDWVETLAPWYQPSEVVHICRQAGILIIKPVSVWYTTEVDDARIDAFDEKELVRVGNFLASIAVEVVVEEKTAELIAETKILRVKEITETLVGNEKILVDAIALKDVLDYLKDPLLEEALGIVYIKAE